LVGHTVGEGGGRDGGSRKCTEEYRGGSVTGVDERQLAWPCVEETEEEKEKRARWHQATLF
jgi:hypothetical protein